MKFHDLLDSKTYFEISLLGNRSETVKTLFWILAALPLVLVCKILRTLVKGAGVLTVGFFLALTLGVSWGLRERFVACVSSFAANLADWVLFPFALANCFSKLILASILWR